MRTLLLACLAALTLCAACGQKGPLVLPQKSVATPVLIHAPAADAAPAAAPEPAPAGGPPGTERKDEDAERSPPRH